MLTDTFLKSFYSNPQLNLDLYFQPFIWNWVIRMCPLPKERSSEWLRLNQAARTVPSSRQFDVMLICHQESLYKDQVESPNAYFK